MFLRTILFSISVLVCAGSVMGQEPGPEFWRKVGCQPLGPRTNLERLEEIDSSLVIKGFTRIDTIDVKRIDIHAIELREFGKAPNAFTAAKGIAVVFMDQNRALIDYAEIDPLLNALETFSTVDETATKLASFEARYRTRGDLELTVFRQTRSGNAVKLAIGICNPITVYLTLDDLAKLRAMIKEAKTRLDEIK